MEADVDGPSPREAMVALMLPRPVRAALAADEPPGESADALYGRCAAVGVAGPDVVRHVREMRLGRAARVLAHDIDEAGRDRAYAIGLAVIGTAPDDCELDRAAAAVGRVAGDVEEALLDADVERCASCGTFEHSWDLVDAEGRVVPCHRCRDAT